MSLKVPRYITAEYGTDTDYEQHSIQFKIVIHDYYIAIFAPSSGDPLYSLRFK